MCGVGGDVTALAQEQSRCERQRTRPCSSEPGIRLGAARLPALFETQKQEYRWVALRKRLALQVRSELSPTRLPVPGKADVGECGGDKGGDKPRCGEYCGPCEGL